MKASSLSFKTWRENEASIKICIEHLELTIHYKGVAGIIPFRKFYAGYLKGQRYAAKFRAHLMTLTKKSEIIKALEEFKNS